MADMAWYCTYIIQDKYLRSIGVTVSQVDETAGIACRLPLFQFAVMFHYLMPTNKLEIYPFRSL